MCCTKKSTFRKTAPYARARTRVNGQERNLVVFLFFLSSGTDFKMHDICFVFFFLLVSVVFFAIEYLKKITEILLENSLFFNRNE